MTDIKNYAIQLIAVSVFFVIIECIQSEGRLKGILKTVTSVIFTLVLIKPVITEFKDFNADCVVSFENYEINSEILENLKNYRKEYLKNQISTYLLSEEINDSQVFVELNVEENAVVASEIKKIRIILPESVILENDENILITKIKDEISKGLNIERELIDVVVQKNAV
ncbi:MAG: hypothetical protein ACI4M6_03945 [Christensenellaceae bacterium]